MSFGSGFTCMEGTCGGPYRQRGPNNNNVCKPDQWDWTGCKCGAGACGTDVRCHEDTPSTPGTPATIVSDNSAPSGVATNLAAGPSQMTPAEAPKVHKEAPKMQHKDDDVSTLMAEKTTILAGI